MYIMGILVNAVYENGQLHLSEPLNLPDGQIVQVQIDPIDDLQALKAILGDAVIWASDADNSDAWLEEQGDELRSRLKSPHSLSDLIIEERNESP
jgi:predicted DNA-binding antitoxin AbrB/MazE fold protein